MRRRTTPRRLEWLDLLEISGPFLSPPVIDRVFPQGLDALDTDHAAKLRLARDDWADHQRDGDRDPKGHAEWVRLVLTDTLEFTPEVLLEPEAIPAQLMLELPEYDVIIRPDFAVAEPAGDGQPRETRLLVHAYAPGQDLDGPVPASAWAATPATRMTQLCRATGVRLGLVTNGERWMLVDAPVGETSAYASWYASLWSQEPDTLRAFRSLLGMRRFFGVDQSETLEAMLADSASYQAEVTEQLGAQVRRAIEVLVRALDRADADSGRRMLADVDESQLYEAAIAVMMRLVFLFFAEESGSLLLGDETYDQYYSASMLRGQLREEADRVGLEVLERRQDAWSRLLATFRGIYGGIDHDALHLPAYGGSLFDPDRFTFLEGRARDTSWVDTEATPLPIDNRTVLHLLDALQVLQIGGPGGEARKLSFRALDIEQIGHVYESLLDHVALRASSLMVGLIGPRGVEPEISVDDLDRARARGTDSLVEHLADQTKKSKSTLSRALERQVAPELVERLRVACGGEELLARVLPYGNLVRTDPWGEPVLVHAGAIFVTAGPERRATGTYYTPRTLTEEVVANALQPLVYSGATEDKPQDAWELKPPSEILALKICDFAMGSGAFLVQACRWLAERLVESWQAAGADDRLITVEGRPSIGVHAETTVPSDPEDRRAHARRLIADRCLHGVDVNPLAVEMAKLSLWLTTLAKDQPFSFLDHALKCGDSLLGVEELDQVRSFHLDPERGQELHHTLLGPLGQLDSALDEALRLREELESFGVVEPRDAYRKAALHQAAEIALARIRQVADLLIGAVISPPHTEADLDAQLQHLGMDLATAFGAGEHSTGRDIADAARRMLDIGNPAGRASRRPFHWPLEFPEVFAAGRKFNALISNPPFLGGVALARTFGEPYERLLKRLMPESKGFVDLAAYFHRRAQNLVRQDGVVALLGPQNLVKSANRKASTDPIIASGRRILWARHKVRWPGTASLYICAIAYGPEAWSVKPVLDGRRVPGISSALDGEVDLSAIARLRPWVRYSEGTHLYGASFVKPASEWEAFTQQEPALRQYLRSYVNADILCSYPESRADLVAVDFGERDKDDLCDVHTTVCHLEENVGRERSRQTRQIHESRPWLHWDKRHSAYELARRQELVLACPRVSKHLPLLMVDSSALFAKTVKFFPGAGYDIYALLQSAIFLTWAFATSPLRGDGIEFSTSSSLDTFSPPIGLNEETARAGEKLWESRKRAMVDRMIGITDLLNLVHDEDAHGGDLEGLRQLQVRVDETVAMLYGWRGLTLDHDFWETRQGVRFTVSPPARAEILQQLRELNLDRFRGTARGKGRREREPAPPAPAETGARS